MCGIAGLVNARGTQIDDQALAAMVRTLFHRGPDGEGTWISPGGHIGLAHRRLAIIDLSPLAAQPMTDHAKRVCVSFNGEIYNHRELRSELVAAGYQFRTDHADTEVLIQGYLAWGITGLLERLNGIFAFALHDTHSGETLLVRDQVGVKPLYFTWRGDTLAFASEIKALFAPRSSRPNVNSAAAFHYLTFMASPAPMTLFEGVYKLPAGHVLRIAADGEIRAERYFAPWPTHTLDSLSEADAVERVRETLHQSVARQLLADVPVGVFLSGGVDSTALLALATQIKGGPPRTFSVGFADPTELDETAYAAEIAARFGAQHTEVRIGAADVATALDALVYEQDEPLADWVCLPLRAVARAAHDAGLKTVLCGEGADEQFCGYEHYLRYLNVTAGPHRWLSAVNTLGVGGPIAALASSLSGRDLRLNFYTDFIRRAALGQEAFWGGAIVFSDGMKRAVWRGPIPKVSENRLAQIGLNTLGPASASSDIVDALLAPIDACNPNAEPLQRMIWLEFAQRLPELLLMRVDKMCMASSLEARVPFLDIEMVRLSSRFGQERKIPDRQPKHLLKQAMAGIVPEDVLRRPKTGFGAPMRDWLRGPLGEFVLRRMAESHIYSSLPLDRRACLSLLEKHRAGDRDYSVYVWTLFNLVLWYDRWIDQENLV